MHSWIPWKLVADPLESSEYTLETTKLNTIHVPVPSQMLLQTTTFCFRFQKLAYSNHTRQGVMSSPLWLRGKAVSTPCQAYRAFYGVILHRQLNFEVQYPCIFSSFLPTRTIFLIILGTFIPASFLLSPLSCVPSSPVTRPL